MQLINVYLGVVTGTRGGLGVGFGHGDSCVPSVGTGHIGRGSIRLGFLAGLRLGRID